MTARLTVLSGPSGVGKGTVVSAIRAAHPDIWVSVSATTRAPRPGERDGVEYRFVSPEQFDTLIASGELLEWAEFAGNRYGTPREPVLQRLSDGVATLLEIDLQGARQVRSAMPQAQFVFLAPPSWQELRRRLISRGTEAESVIQTRLARAEVEMQAGEEFDEVVVNDNVGETVTRLVSLVRSACAESDD